MIGGGSPILGNLQGEISGISRVFLLSFGRVPRIYLAVQESWDVCLNLDGDIVFQHNVVYSCGVIMENCDRKGDINQES